MAIRKIKVSNFKSFKNLDVELREFNALIGANASGKSNFIQIFTFLRDIVKHGLENAISLQGGTEYLRNINIGSSEDFSLEVVSSEQGGRFYGASSRVVRLRGLRITMEGSTYRFGLKFKGRGSGFEIAQEELVLDCVFQDLGTAGRKSNEDKQAKGKVILSRVSDKLEIKIDPPQPADEVLPVYGAGERLPPRTMLIESPFVPGFSRTFLNAFLNTAVYDFDPKLPKKATPITGKAELEEDASNLAIVLKTIIENKEQKRKLSNLVKDLLPFVADLDVEKFADKSLLFSIRERYSAKHYLPASLISDGTINITALIVALYFQKKPLTIIEEPERNVHPRLISKIQSMMKDAAQNKQILVTTHNPEMVRHADLNDILLASRDEQGFSTVSRPAEKQDVKTFLDNEMGIEELYVQDLLGT